MCLAEALLRIPDRATRDALIRDKISTGNWRPCRPLPVPLRQCRHLGLVRHRQADQSTSSEAGLSRADPLIGRSGEPMIRKGVDMAMRMMGEQFVTGQTIAEAWRTAARWKPRASAIPTTCSARPRPPPPMPTATTRLRAGDPRHRQGLRKARHLRRPRHFHQALRPAPALQPRAAGPGDGELLPRVTTLACWPPIRHRPEHRCRGSRPAGTVARPAGSVCASTRAWRAGTASASSCRPTRSAPACAGLHHRPRPPQRPPGDGATGERRILGQRDQARPGRRAGRLPGLHPQDPHRRVLHRLRPQAAGGAGCHLPAIRHAQCPDAVGHPCHGRQNFYPASTSSSVCTAWASRFTKKSSAATS
jgi:hypothetical protein